MARAPETAFYFEPISERLALVIEGAPFPSDDHWAHVGDPAEMNAELARLECAHRWPGVDPDLLAVEMPTDFAAMAAQMESGESPGAPGEVPGFDVELLLQQAEALREMAAELKVPTVQELEGAAETVGEAIERANKD